MTHGEPLVLAALWLLLGVILNVWKKWGGR